MRRFLAIGGVVALVAAIGWTAAVVFAQRGRSVEPRREWPLGLGAIDDVPKRYPAHETSRDAARLIELASAAGVELTPPYAAARGATAPVDAIRPLLSRYLDDQLTRVDDRIDAPPPEVAGYAAAHDTAIRGVAAYLLQNTAIVWPTDVEAAAQAPLPNLTGHLALTRLLVAHALAALSGGDRHIAEDDLRAAWHLQRDLWHRPELISKIVALSGTRLVNAAVRKLPPPVSWHSEIRGIDFRRSVLAAQQAEMWAVRSEVEREAGDAGAPLGSPRRFAELIMQPYDLMCAGNLAAISRRAAEELARSSDCAVDGAALDRRIHAMRPFWNREHRFPLPSLGSVWQRVARTRAEIELTSKVLELKSRAAAPDLHSDCADGTWIYEPGHLRFSRDIPAPRPQLAIPLEWIAE
jgi:hypothetical protein